MKRIALLLAIPATFAFDASAEDASNVKSKTVYELLRHDATVEKAVRQTLAEKPADPLQRDTSLLRGDSYTSFRRQVDDATVPDCLHSEGLKRQPTFFLSGWLALPFVAVAKVRGKCQ
ncbi:hypothetical protein [Massilia sp. 9096]|uniref:hypothetical protein n=1 Tax=Massilia sp. 9096 TaxID=1500894 RepID=UPI00055EA07B|nr:hypothetical protein [Massilia sp. 9096]